MVMGNNMPPMVAPARIPDDLADVRALFHEYADSLGFDLGFQGFQEELERLPGEYSEPGGALLLARDAGHASGCVGFRRLAEDTCEMKRLYVQPRARGGRLGRRLAEAAIAEARRRGYHFMRLDTVPSMTEAIRLYESLGFVRIAPYRHNPIEGAVFMELAL
jgi:ribosomal protein S18 acetylase RimI-like enzyme